MSKQQFSVVRKLGIAFWTLVFLASLVAVGYSVYQARANPVVVEDTDPTLAPGYRFAPEPSEVDLDQVKWIKDNAVAMASVDPKNEDFADLESLKEIIGDARIVQLGEQSHGDAVCFETKIRLIKFLHQEMGFDVIAFESGLYDCDQAWQAYQRGDNVMSAASEGVFGIWTGSAQTAELWRYIGRQSKTDRPLELCGFDCQFTGAASQSRLVDDVRNLAETYANETIQPEELDTFCWTISQLIEKGQGGNGRAEFDATIKKLSASLNQALEDSDGKADEEIRKLKFWKQELVSMQGLVDYKWRDVPGPPGFSLDKRDAQMAENLKWLAEEQFKDRKIIVWAASYHIARDLQSIETPESGLDYSNAVRMGEWVDRYLGDQVFTIGFTTYEGRAGTHFSRGFPVTPAVAGTFEDLCNQAGLVNALIPLKSEDAKWLDQPMFARPMGYSWMRAVWHKHFDAMIFNREMTQSSRFAQ